jgi:AcrR family transcriptional regulator
MDPRTGGKRREAMRLRLREAAWATVRERGLDGTTVRAVAEAAGCAIGAVYLYYPDKTALLKDLVLAALGDLAREVASRSQLAPLDAVTTGMRAVFGPGRPAADLLLVLFRSSSAAEPEFGRWVAGRLLTALAPLAAQHPGATPQEGAASALAATCFAFGLTLFESSGLLRRLGADAGQVVAAAKF